MVRTDYSWKYQWFAVADLIFLRLWETLTASSLTDPPVFWSESPKLLFAKNSTTHLTLMYCLFIHCRIWLTKWMQMGLAASSFPNFCGWWPKRHSICMRTVVVVVCKIYFRFLPDLSRQKKSVWWLWHYRLRSFQGRGTKFERFLQNQHYWILRIVRKKHFP